MMPRLRDMPGWIVNETKRQKGQMEPAAASRLAEMVGEETRVAAQEITKLLTYVNFTRPVSVADVEAVSIVSAQGDVFALVDALGSGDGKKAQKVLHQLLENEDPFALWGMVIRQFRLLLQAKGDPRRARRPVRGPASARTARVCRREGYRPVRALHAVCAGKDLSPLAGNGRGGQNRRDAAGRGAGCFCSGDGGQIGRS